MITIEGLSKRQNENRYEYIWRICEMKENGEIEMDWQGVADLLNRELCTSEDEYKDAASYRKPYQSAKSFFENVFSKRGQDETDYVRELREAKERLCVERVRIRDERNEISRMMREKARQESFIDAVRAAFVEDVKPFEPIQIEPQYDGSCEMIVHLTDIHAGLGIENNLNHYDEDTMYDRLARYAEYILDIAFKHQCDECTVVLGGDMISGLIHTSIRIENTEHVISQTKRVCSYIAEFIKRIDVFHKLKIYSVSGNHSRLMQNKDAQLDGEELDALIPFYLKAVFANNTNIDIQDNDCGDYIATFDVCGHRWVAVHGDRDNPMTVASDMTKMLGYIPDGVLMGHRHTNGMMTDGKTKIIQSGCVCGTDRYAYDKRLFGKPEQMIIISDHDNTVKCLYDIQL